MLRENINWVKKELVSSSLSLILIYVVVYGLWGTAMNYVGTVLEIARFTYWWQIITVYLLYMIPISLVLRNQPWHRQYAYGLIFMGLLEFGGYAMETSYAYTDNMIDQFFGVRNFSLAMSLFFAFYFPLGNALVNRIHQGMGNYLSR